MLQIKNLTVTHKKDLKVLFSDVSFTLKEGEKAALIGEEGNGKSTLLKLLYDEKLVGDYAEYTGEILKHHEKLGYLAQELTKEQGEKTVYELLSEKETFFDSSPKELSKLAAELGVAADFFYSGQKAGSLSGGEKVKLQLAGILMERPDILLLDEPSNDLDLKALMWLEDFIRAARQPVLFISHDETLLSHTANVIFHLEQLKRKTEAKHTIAHMGYEEYVDTRRKLLNHTEQVAKKQKNEYKKQQEKYQKIRQKVEHEQNAVSRQNPHGGQLLKKKMHAVKSMGKRMEREKEGFQEIPDTEEAMFLRFSGKGFPAGKKVVDIEIPLLKAGGQLLARHIKLTVRGPERVCIVGDNGVGKTTLMKELVRALSGREDIRAGYMPQNYGDCLDLQKTPVEFLTKNGDQEESVRIRTYLGSMKYTAEEMEHEIGHLSGGQKAKLFLLKMSMDGCDVMLLDEPTRNFSPLSNPVIRRLLSRFPGAIISISHDRKYMEEVCTGIYRLHADGLTKIEMPK